MRAMNRRQFMKRGLAAVGTVALGHDAITNWIQADDVHLPQHASDRVKLGKTGIELSFLGMGTGSIGWNHESNQTRLGQARFTELVRHAFDRGITFFDAADAYGSHPFLKEALKSIPREKYQLQSKIIHREPETAAKDIDRFLQELGVEYIDSVLIHVVERPKWHDELEGVRKVLSDAKAKGKIRAHGCTCHTLAALQTAAASSWVEVDQARFNHKGASMDAKPDQVAPVLQQMRGAGKGVIGMKIFGNGTFKQAEDRDASLRYVLSQNALNAMVIGLESPAQVDEAIQRLDRALGSVHSA